MKAKIMSIGFLIALSMVVVVATEAVAAKTGTNPTATIKTNKGTIVMELFPKETPISVENFIKLANKKYYDGLTWHRYVPGFVIQGGDPKGDGSGGPGYSIQDEPNTTLKHDEGAVGMAKSAMPNSAGSQFYICLAPVNQLDGNYTVFGKVTKGMNVVKELRQGDKMITITITDPRVKAKPAAKKK